MAERLRPVRCSTSRRRMMRVGLDMVRSFTPCRAARAARCCPGSQGCGGEFPSQHRVLGYNTGGGTQPPAVDISGAEWNNFAAALRRFAERSPFSHEPAAFLEQVAASICSFDAVPD